MKKSNFILFIWLALTICACQNQPTTKEKNSGADTLVQKVTAANDAIDTVKTDSAIPSAPIKKEAETNIELSDIFEYYDKEPQSFTFASNKDTSIVCNEGTTLTIKANSFVIEKSGQPVNGKIQLSIKEYYKLSDMLLANLSTMSDNQLLETGGMVNITATSNRVKCKIKEGSAIEIGFPYTSKKEGMQLFTGEKSTNSINWKPLPQQQFTYDRGADYAESESPVGTMEEPEGGYQIVEQMPQFPGGTDSLIRYMSANFIAPKNDLQNNISGTVYLRFVIDRLGNTTKTVIVRSLSQDIDKAAIDLVENMPNWIPGRQGGKRVSVAYTLPIRIIYDEKTKELKIGNSIDSNSINSNNIGINSSIVTNVESRLEGTNPNPISNTEINRYITYTTNLDWINCDAFTYDNRQRINYTVQTNNPNTFIVVIFKSKRSIMDGISVNGKVIFKNVPIGESITIIAIKTEDNTIALAVKETTIKTGIEPPFEFQPSSLPLLKSELKKLDGMFTY